MISFNLKWLSILLIGSLFLPSSIIHAQGVNLVPNPSFEEHFGCNSLDWQTSGSLAFFPDQPTAKSWYRATNTTPDYLNTCSSDFNTGVPFNAFSGVYSSPPSPGRLPHTGDAYAGLYVTYTPGWQEYIETKLTSTLIAGAKYKVSYWVALGDNYAATKDLGIHFTPNNISNPIYSEIILTPELITPNYIPVSNDWVKLEYTYTANGTENWMTIGCFTDQNLIVTLPPTPTSSGYSYYFIDDVSVIPIKDTVIASHDTAGCLDNDRTIQLNGNSSAASWVWNDGSTHKSLEVNQEGTYWVIATSADSVRINIDTFHVTSLNQDSYQLNIGNDTTLCTGKTLNIGTPDNDFISYHWNTGANTPHIEVTQSGIYYLTIQAICNTYSDSIHVSFYNCDRCIWVPSAFSPNGDATNDIFLVEGSCPISYFNLQIYNRYGQRVFHSNDINKGWDGNFNGRPCDAGSYYYSLRAEVKRDKKEQVYFKGDIALIR